VHSANTHEAVENELIRTIRHLENTKVVERDGSPLALWVLGSAEPTTADFSKDRLKLDRHDGPEWIQLVLNAVTRMPAVQLASIDQRAVFIAAKLRKQINVAIIAVGLVTTGFTLVQLIDWFETRLRVQQIDSQVAQLVADSASAQERIASYSVSPQLVRQALELDAREVEHAPDMGSHLKVLAQAVTQATGVRLTALEWSYVPAGQLPCTGSTQSPTTPQTSAPEGDVTTGNGPKVEMKFKTKPPAGWTLQKQEYEWAQFSKRLQANLGYTVASDPITLGRVGTLSIDATKHGNEDVTKEWCLVIDPSAKATKDQTQ
jgi:DNA-binding transcriptional regulator YdaS (Cro superfamily)